MFFGDFCQKSCEKLLNFAKMFFKIFHCTYKVFSIFKSKILLCIPAPRGLELFFRKMKDLQSLFVETDVALVLNLCSFSSLPFFFV